jgi:hypothetical protein
MAFGAPSLFLMVVAKPNLFGTCSAPNKRDPILIVDPDRPLIAHAMKAIARRYEHIFHPRRLIELSPTTPSGFCEIGSHGL